MEYIIIGLLVVNLTLTAVHLFGDSMWWQRARTEWGYKRKRSGERVSRVASKVRRKG